MIPRVFLLLLQVVPGPLDAGLAASREGRYEEAVQLLEQAVAQTPSYEALVALGVAQGRLGRGAEARRAFDRAVTLDPRRPEAHVERGGLEFLETRYEEAVSDLRRAMRRRPDAYTRDMLASALHLAGRGEAALREWNKLGKPLVQSIEIQGLRRLDPRFVRRELAVKEGQMLTPGRLRTTLTRLTESRLFGRVEVRAVPLAEGRANVDVRVSERRGLGEPLQLVGMTVAHALSSRVKYRYDNLFPGFSLGAQYRWERTQPKAEAEIDWTRPLGLPISMQIAGGWEKPQYDLAGAVPIVMEAHGAEVNLRHVLTGRTVAGVGFRVRDRTFSRRRFDAPAGVLTGLQAFLERRMIDSRRQRLDASVRFFQAMEELGSDFVYPRGVAGLRYQVIVWDPGSQPLPGTAIALQAQWAIGGTGMPLDEMFSPGAASEMEFPLRAHRQKENGVLGKTPIGRNLIVGNVELRQRLFSTRLFQLGLVTFYDAARVDDVAVGPRQVTLQDAGAGLRLALQGSLVLRADVGWSLTGDGKRTVTAGIGHVF